MSDIDQSRFQPKKNKQERQERRSGNKRRD